MIQQKQVIARARQLYADLKKRSAPRYWQNGRMKGRLRVPGVPLPYDVDDFIDWLTATVGCNAFLCPYCNAPLDVLSMVLDHSTALKRGGTNDFSNLVPCCRDCNGVKSSLDGSEFRLFMHLLQQLPAPARADILTRLRTGAMGVRMRFMDSRKTPKEIEI